MPKVLAVIQYTGPEKTIEQAAIALRCGADGVFLSSQDGSDNLLVPLAIKLADIWKGTRAHSREKPFIGVNLPCTNPLSALAKAADAGLDGVWVDSPGIGSFGVSPAGRKLATLASRNARVLVFASVAFEYQPDELDAPGAACLACELGMIPTTSGPGGGMPPTLDKIKGMSTAARGCLALASELDIADARSFAPYLSHMLVTTEMPGNGRHFTVHRLEEFVAAVHAVP